MPLASGTRLGPYEVLAPLGAGGMGEVYRALDTRLGRDIALKLLPPELSGSPDRLARFEREARMVAKLSHPNIVVLYSVDEHEGTKFLTMELVDGKSLADMIAPGGLPIDRVLELAIALTEALAAAHEKGVVHRDLKPANVMLTRDGRVKVLDFGLAKHFQADPDDGATLTAAAPISEVGQVLGTMPYMAPEQIRGENVDVRSDLYALGVLLYEMVSGKRPFGGATSIDLASSILRDEAPDLAGVPEDFQRVVERCLQKNPRERYQTAIDVGNELRRVGRGATRPALKSSKAEPSVAVLPFANRSADPEDEFFADGLADELLSTLARLSGLRVAARTSSSQFRGTKDDLATIGRKLNVESIIEGSVRKAGNRVRISVQLVKVVDGYRVWSDTYDRTLDDVFAVQDDIAQSVVKALRRELLGEAHDSDASRELLAEVTNAARNRSANPEAQRLLVQARALAQYGPVESHARVIELLEKAVAVDPTFAMAWAELGDIHRRRGGMSTNREEFERANAQARSLIERALVLDPDLAEAHANLGMVHRNGLNWKGADASMRRALELDPGSPSIQFRAGTVALSCGDVERAETLLRRVVDSDPLNHGAIFFLGVLLDSVGRHGEAIENFERALELSPTHPSRRAACARSLLAVGREEDAFTFARQETAEPIRLWSLASLFQEIGQTEEADLQLAKLIDAYSLDAAFQIALVYAIKGDADATFQWLERARDLHDPGLSDVMTYPELRTLYGDPRWRTFMESLRYDWQSPQ